MMSYIEEEDDDEYFEDPEYSRIEETRDSLEMELGCDVFCEAYKLIQVYFHVIYVQFYM